MLVVRLLISYNEYSTFAVRPTRGESAEFGTWRHPRELASSFIVDIPKRLAVPTAQCPPPPPQRRWLTFRHACTPPPKDLTGKGSTRHTRHATRHTAAVNDVCVAELLQASNIIYDNIIIIIIISVVSMVRRQVYTYIVSFFFLFLSEVSTVCTYSAVAPLDRTTRPRRVSLPLILDRLRHRTIVVISCSGRSLVPRRSPITVSRNNNII